MTPKQNAEDFASAILGKPNPLDAVAQRYQGGGFASIDYTPNSERAKRG